MLLQRSARAPTGLKCNSAVARSRKTEPAATRGQSGASFVMLARLRGAVGLFCGRQRRGFAVELLRFRGLRQSRDGRVPAGDHLGNFVEVTRTDKALVFDRAIA